MVGKQFHAAATVITLALQMCWCTTALAWVSPASFPNKARIANHHRSASPLQRGTPSPVRSSGFSGRKVLPAAERSAYREGRGEGGRVGGVRGLAAAVRFFPGFKRERQLDDDAPPVYRSADRIERLVRLPFWPIQNGLLFTLLDVLQLRKLALALEDMWGGRVGTLMPSDVQATDPFVLLAHHRHSFWPIDPLRQLTKQLLPEGFPAHPHRGFQTVTYVMKGGMTHRDSMGIKQQYGEGQVQWMSAGRGIIHEEMWDLEDWVRADIEIYQIWVNLPSSLKMTRPRLQVAGKGSEFPLPIVHPSKGTEVVVIAGELCDEVSPVETMQPLSMLHVKMDPGAESWSHRVPWGHRCLIYVRRGDLTLIPTEEGYYDGEEDRGPQLITAGDAVYLAQDGDYAKFENRGTEKLDFMLIEAEPTGEHVAFRSNMVMNTERELDQARADFVRGFFGKTWDHRLTDDEWRESVQGSTGKRTSYKTDEA